MVEVGPGVLGKAGPAVCLGARAFEIENDRIHEHGIDGAEQIASSGEMVLL